MSLDFDLPKDRSNILKVIGVGGGGSNAVNHMCLQGIKDVDFIVCNTDQQALDMSPVPVKVQLGLNLTEGRGAGSIPEVGKNAALESVEELKEMLSGNTTMVFITAGMGGGTGTGAAPVIAKMTKDMGILTVGIVTIPFGFEGPRRKKLAEQGLAELRECVDTLLVIKNDKLRELHGNLSVGNAFHESDNILTTAAKGIADVISSIGYINVDMNDINTVMRNSGVAIMGSAQTSGENRAGKAVREALESPLLNDNEITGAEHVLLNITFGENDVTMDELDEITQYIQNEAGQQAEVIMGYGHDDTLGDALNVTVIATGFKTNMPNAAFEDEKPVEKKYHDLGVKPETKIVVEPTEISAPLESPVSETEDEGPTFEEPFIVKKDPMTFEQEPTDVQQEFRSEVSQFTEEVEEHEFVDEPLNGDLGFTPDIMKIDSPTEEQEEIQSETELEKKYFTLSEEDDDEGEKTLDLSDKTEAPTFEFETEKMSSFTEPVITAEEHQRRNRERMSRIKELSMKLKTPSGVTELEQEPAFKRSNIQLDSTPHSSHSDVSKYNLTEDASTGEGKVSLRKENPFFTDNVD